MARRVFFEEKSFVRVVGVLGLITLFCAGSQSVFAQESSAGITVKPSMFEDKLDPGDAYESVVRVTNETPSQQTYYVSVNDIVDITEGGTPLFATPERQAVFGISEWMTYPTDPIVVEAGATIEIPFTITVPADATPGSHTGGIFIGPKAERPEEIGTGVGYQIVPIVTIQISGDLVEDADIRSFSTKKLFYGKPDVDFSISIENKGNVAIRPRGPIEIQNMFGKIVGTVMVNDTAGLVLPNTKRLYEVQWLDEEEIYFGRLVANATIVYGDQERRSIIRSVSFWMLPMNIITPILVGLLVLFGGVYALVKLYIRKHLRAIEKATGKTLKSVPKDQESISRLSFIAVLLLAFTIVFLMVLFFFFA